jgi:HSP20 family molecular chaperone IbpA
VYYVDTFEILIQSLTFAISSICSQILTNTRVIHFLRKPYLDSKTPTMKLYIAAAALPALVSSYSMGSGGFRYYGCPDIFVSPGRAQEEGFSCDPRGSWQAAQQQQQKEWVDRAFEQLESEFNNNGTPNRQRRAQRSEEFVNSSDDGKYLDLRQQQQQEYLQKQQEWVNRAFGLATEVASEIATSSSSGRDFKEAKNEAVRQQQEWLNRAFGLATEVASDIAASSSSSSRRGVEKEEAKNEEAVQKQHEDVLNRDDENDEARRQQQQQQQQEYLQKQQEWVNQAFGLAPQVPSTGNDVKEAKKEAVRQQQEWLNQAFGLATDVASGLSSPRYEVNDGNDAFQVALDVPGVKASDIDISFNENDSVLKVSGKRDIGKGGVTRTVKFSKSFSLDSSVVDKDKISAQINNGVLLVTAPKAPIEPKENKVRQIPVMEVGPENVPVQGPAESAASDKPSPESKLSQTQEPTDGTKKDDEKSPEEPTPEKV